MNKARLTKVIVALAAFVILMQVFQPKRTNPPVVPENSITAHTQVPEGIRLALMRACGDCHSNRTQWPWYSRVAPLSWVIIDDVNQGRRRLNLDDWRVQERREREDDPLAKICKEVRQGAMPPFSYRITHRDSQLNPQEIASVCSWSQSVQSEPTRQQNLRP